MAKKKGKADVGKLVDAQAKGKKAAGKDSKRAGASELDERQSKFSTAKWIGPG